MENTSFLLNRLLLYCTSSRGVNIYYTLLKVGREGGRGRDVICKKCIKRKNKKGEGYEGKTKRKDQGECSVLEPEPQGAETFGLSRRRISNKVSAPALRTNRSPLPTGTYLFTVRTFYEQNN
jgi:hypothetical protein